MFTDFKSLVSYIISNIFSPIMAFIVALAVLYFMWGVLTFIRSGDNESAREKGRSMIIYGIIGLAVMFSVWGLVNILINTFHVGGVIPRFS